MIPPTSAQTKPSPRLERTDQQITNSMTRLGWPRVLHVNWCEIAKQGFDKSDELWHKAG